MKATITWKGEPGSGLDFNEWAGYKFEKDKPVEVDNETVIKKAQANPFYTVKLAPEAPEKK